MATNWCFTIFAFITILEVTRATSYLNTPVPYQPPLRCSQRCGCETFVCGKRRGLGCMSRDPEVSFCLDHPDIFEDPMSYSEDCCLNACNRDFPSLSVSDRYMCERSCRSIRVEKLPVGQIKSNDGCQGLAAFEKVDSSAFTKE